MHAQSIGVYKLIKINTLKDMDEKVLTLICDYLKPVTYSENSFVFCMGDPLDCLLFIIKGTMWTYASLSDSLAGQGISSMAIKPLGKVFAKCFFQRGISS